MSTDRLYALIGAALALAVAALLAGRYLWPCREGMERELDDAYDDGRADQKRYDLDQIAWLENQVRAWQAQTAPHDALHPAYEALTQEALDAANSLPGPESPSTGAPDRAGESHETPLPAILHLGQEGDGTEDTYARVWFAQRKMILNYEREQAALMASCGLPYRGLVAA